MPGISAVWATLTPSDLDTNAPIACIALVVLAVTSPNECIKSPARNPWS